MCGIAGMMVTEGGVRPETEELRRMAWSLRHRGPDGYGMYVEDRVGFVHTRLALIDRAGGAQPMSDADGAVWVTFNGEIFNYVELREELESLGRRFRTRSDTEVIVQAYLQWGSGAWERFNGQFAFALRDRREDCVWLVRDRVGIAPLHYAVRDGALVFASEAKAIFASGRVTAKADPASIAMAFTLWSVPAPGTVFEGVRVLLPGTATKFDSQLRTTEQRYHTTRFGATSDTSSLTIENAADELTRLLERAVKIRLRADVPVGAYLSGGLDSSVIARLVRLSDSSPLQTFSVRFADQRYDEGEAQRRMASDLGTTHHEIVATPDVLGSELPRVVRHCEAPLLRTAPVPMFVLSSLVRRLGMRVVLTGEGADEFLGGYDVFKEDKVRRFWARDTESAMRPALLGRVHPYVANAKGAMWREFFRRGLEGVDRPFYSHQLRWENTAWAQRFLSPEVRGALTAEAMEERIEGSLPPGWREGGAMERAQQIEIATFMTPYLLASQGDRAIMANGVEGRYPYLDPEVNSFCAGLPSRLKMCGLREKVTLRAAARRILPREVADRRKWPYRAPIGEALFGANGPEYARELLSDVALKTSGLVDGRAAASLAARAWDSPGKLGEREEMALVGMLTVQLWWKEFMQGSGIGAADGADSVGEPLVFEDHRRDGAGVIGDGKRGPGRNVLGSGMRSAS